MKRGVFVFLLLFAPSAAAAQFAAGFEDDALSGWEHETGDGNVQMAFRAEEGRGIVTVDATQDRHNIWWAVIRRDVSEALELSRLERPGWELRVQARIRVSHAPRRVNMSLHTQRTTDFYSHLMEFDIPDTTRRHDISMTTEGFEAQPGDAVNAQLALMDWGRQTHAVEVDSFAVSVVNTNTAQPDLGTAVPYPPLVPDPDTLAHHVPAAHDGMIHRRYPSTLLRDWHTTTDSGRAPALTLAPEQYVLFRWASEDLPEETVSGAGVLELPLHGVQQSELEADELGRVRVVEILGGDPQWTEDAVTFDRFTQGQPLHEVLNPQMIVDVDVSEASGKPVRVPIPEPVLQRLTAGETHGIALRPLGPIVATFSAREATGQPGATLHFSTSSVP